MQALVNLHHSRRYLYRLYPVCKKNARWEQSRANGKSPTQWIKACASNVEIVLTCAVSERYKLIKRDGRGERLCHNID